MNNMDNTKLVFYPSIFPSFCLFGVYRSGAEAPVPIFWRYYLYLFQVFRRACFSESEISELENIRLSSQKLLFICRGGWGGPKNSRYNEMVSAH